MLVGLGVPREKNKPWSSTLLATTDSVIVYELIKVSFSFFFL